MSPFGNILGVRMNLLIGPDPVALPAPLEALESLLEIEIVQSDRGPSGFKIAFAVGRSGPLEFLDSPLVVDPRFNVDARVIVTMIFDIVPAVIFDGIVTERNLRPGGASGEGVLTLLGRDLSWQLDKETKQVEHPAMDETAIAALIALSYPQYGMIPMTIPPLVVDPPIPIDRTPQQYCSDWKYLKLMARRHGYEVYIDPGPAPGTNTLYWGPPIPPGLQQKTMSVNQGPASDAFDVQIDHSAEELTSVEGSVQDRLSGQTVPVVAPLPTRPPLGLVPEGVRRIGSTRKTPIPTSGLNAAQAYGRALAEVDASAAEPIRVSGTLNTVRYNAPLKARSLVDLRGVGLTFDGTYKVSEVRHRIRPGDYVQDFTLTRSELGPKLPLVRPG
jgi:hypothetical protein